MSSRISTVDVLLATFNGQKFLSDQLCSIETQTYRDWRVIARDDGSTDSTASILESFRRRHPGQVILLPINAQNLGICSNFDRLLAASDAPYFMPCDQDDIWLPEKLAQMVKVVQQAEHHCGAGHPVLLHSDLVVVDERKRTLASSLWKLQLIDPRRSRWNNLIVQNVVTGCAAIGNAALRDHALPIPKEAVMHDWWLALVASVTGQIEWLAAPTVLYRQHDRNDTGAKPWSLASVARSIPNLVVGNRLRDSIARYAGQAGALLAAHGDKLPEYDRSGLELFSQIHRFSWFRRRQIIWRYAIRKTGFLRNAALLARI